MATTYVLVGGAWLGAWAWKTVAGELRARGADVYPATLTGLGERTHLARPEVDLETHIADVVNLIEFEDLAEITLVGHSYAGAVVTGVADRLGERLGQLVYLDSGPLDDGEAFIDFYPPEARAEVERQVAELGDGWRLPFPSFEALGAQASLAGLGEAERALMVRKAAAQPFRTYLQPLRLGHPGGGDYERVVIACDDFRQLIAAGIPRFQSMTASPWRLRELATGHWPMLSTPHELTALLHSVAAGA
jgi:pimeloyl-ACP methyl ester carboxylesterase